MYKKSRWKVQPDTAKTGVNPAGKILNNWLLEK